MSEPRAEQPRPGVVSGEAARELLCADAVDVSTLSTLEEVDFAKLDLTSLPPSLDLCTRVVKLNLSDNPRLKFPSSLHALSSMRILFAASVGMEEVPKALAKCGSLKMLGVRTNKLERIEGTCLPEQLEWLIAANNQIRELPDIPRCRHIRKLMLSHNQLTCAALEPVAQIPDLEMIRVASNRLEAFPQALLRHRRLAWVAVSGNPFAEEALAKRMESAPAPIDYSEVCVGSKLGSGAGATVFRGSWQGREVAVKMWDQEIFSDGSAKAEWSLNVAASSPGHPSLVNVLGAFSEPRPGMVLELLDEAKAAAGPPTPATVTRDALTGDSVQLNAFGAVKVAETVALAGAYLHSQGLTHGDIYLHNTLVIPEREAPPDLGGRVGVRDARLSDFGAAAAVADSPDGLALQRLELRSYGWLLQDMLEMFLSEPTPHEAEAVRVLKAVRERCAQEDVDKLPSFSDLVGELSGVSHQDSAL